MLKVAVLAMSEIASVLVVLQMLEEVLVLVGNYPERAVVLEAAVTEVQLPPPQLGLAEARA